MGGSELRWLKVFLFLNAVKTRRLVSGNPSFKLLFSVEVFGRRECPIGLAESRMNVDWSADNCFWRRARRSVDANTGWRSIDSHAAEYCRRNWNDRVYDISNNATRSITKQKLEDHNENAINVINRTCCE